MGILVVSFIVFLFGVYTTSHDDFVLVRKNIGIDQIFNLAFLTAGASLSFARLLYVSLHFNEFSYNLIRVIFFPYVPGLSLLGAILGGTFFIVWYTSSHKVPTLRLLDFFSVSVISTLPVGFLFSAILYKQRIISEQFGLTFLYIVIAIFFVFFLLPWQKRGDLQEGSLFLLFGISFTAISLVDDILSKTQKIYSFISIEGIIVFIVLIVSLVLLFKKEKWIAQWKK